jgi:cell division protein FtsQ
LSDPDDVKVVANDPQGPVLVHLGSSNFLERYKVYVAHLQEWRQQFNPVQSVDLRYDRQIIVNPDLRGVANAPLASSSARVSLAGVRPAALITHGGKPSAAPIRVPRFKSAKTPVAHSRNRWTKAKSVTRIPAAERKAAATKPVNSGEARASAGAQSIRPAVANKKPSPAISKDQGAQ